MHNEGSLDFGLKEKSASRIHFQAIASNICKAISDNPEDAELLENPNYFPKLVRYLILPILVTQISLCEQVWDPLVNDIMALAPLWSAGTLKSGKRHSNAEVENHFRSMKKSKAFGHRLTYASFLSMRYTQTKQRLARLVRLTDFNTNAMRLKNHSLHTAALKGITSMRKTRKGAKESYVGALESWSDRRPLRKKPRYLPTSPIIKGLNMRSKPIGFTFWFGFSHKKECNGFQNHAVDPQC